MKKANRLIEIKPPALLMPDPERYNIFLAGSIENGRANEWQKGFSEEIDLWNPKTRVALFNPRRDNWEPSWGETYDNPELIAQIEWELDHLEMADLIVMYLQPGTMSPISMLELGLFAKEVKSKKKGMIVLCPKGFYRKANVDTVCRYYGITMVDDMKDLIEKTKRNITAWNRKNKLK